MTRLDLLDDKELHELTGTPQPKRQIAWLKAEGFIFRVGSDGRVKMLREHVTAQLGAPVAAPVRRRGPNLDATPRGVSKL